MSHVRRIVWENEHVLKLAINENNCDPNLNSNCPFMALPDASVVSKVSILEDMHISEYIAPKS